MLFCHKNDLVTDHYGLWIVSISHGASNKDMETKATLKLRQVKHHPLGERFDPLNWEPIIYNVDFLNHHHRIKTTPVINNHFNNYSHDQTLGHMIESAYLVVPLKETNYFHRATIIDQVPVTCLVSLTYTATNSTRPETSDDFIRH